MKTEFRTVKAQRKNVKSVILNMLRFLDSQKPESKEVTAPFKKAVRSIK